MRAAVAALLLVLASTGTSSASGYDAASQGAALDRLTLAWQRLSNGESREAQRAFAHELAYWSPWSRQSLGYVDAEKGLMIAAIFARDDAQTASAWRRIRADSSVAEPAADALVFAGRWNDAWRTYRDGTHDNAMVDPHEGPDRVVAAGVERALRGDLRGAIAAWSRPAAGGGVYELTDLQTALSGLARARQRDWKGAEHDWLCAARMRRNVPQLAEFTDANFMALAMLWHFRAHFARGEHAYRWGFVPAS
jgi:hypothetical protein